MKEKTNLERRLDAGLAGLKREEDFTLRMGIAGLEEPKDDSFRAGAVGFPLGNLSTLFYISDRGRNIVLVDSKTGNAILYSSQETPKSQDKYLFA